MKSTKLTRALIVLIAALSIADYISTDAALSSGMFIELNPIAHAVGGAQNMFLIKLAALGIIWGRTFFWDNQNRIRFANALFLFGVPWTGFFVVFNTAQLVYAGVW